jgi:hypothetical protein
MSTDLHLWEEIQKQGFVTRMVGYKNQQEAEKRLSQKGSLFC